MVRPVLCRLHASLSCLLSISMRPPMMSAMQKFQHCFHQDILCQMVWKNSDPENEMFPFEVLCRQALVIQV